jgi:hypothetical protein
MLLLLACSLFGAAVLAGVLLQLLRLCRQLLQ